MHAQSLQDPLTDQMVGIVGKPNEQAGYPTTRTALRAPPNLAAAALPVCRSRRINSCGQEVLQETAIRTKLEEELQAERQENAELRQRIKQQFQDLEQLENILGKLETQVEGHEVVIKQQSLRIQDQEQTIQQLNLRLQLYLAVLLEHPHKTLF